MKALSNKNIRIIGLDLAFTGPIGVSVFQVDGSDKTLTITKHVKFKEPWLRHVYILKTILAFLRPTDVVFIEDYAFSQHSAADAKLKEVGGIIRLAIYQRTKLYPVVIGTSQLKKYVTNHGLAKKEMMLKEIYKKWGKDFDDNNKADAYALARLGWNFLGFGTDKLNEYQQKMFNELRKGLYEQQTAILEKVQALALSR